MSERAGRSAVSSRGRRAMSRWGRWPFSFRFRYGHAIIAVLILAVVLSAVASIASAHLTRVQYSRLQHMESRHDQLQATWSRLLLEESTWSTPSRIENLARDRLSMHVPDVDNTRVMRP
ncbi:cell division protein FtsL [Kushneria sinocarnis]|nr:cell division protein FtsL [Kushneria sinocarnis]